MLQSLWDFKRCSFFPFNDIVLNVWGCGHKCYPLTSFSNVNSIFCRTGIAYIANVAVRKEERRKGIAKMLVQEAEARARSWGCRSMALHCDVNNIAALRLYKNQGFKCIRVPEGARWPEPKIAEGVRYSFMMKLVPKT